MKSQKVVAVGGSIRNTFWMQNKADVTGKVIEVPDIKEASALGAAYVCRKLMLLCHFGVSESG